MFDTYEEADELRYKCVYCGKNKLDIVSKIKAGEPRTYSLERCTIEGCVLHCKGHDVHVEHDLEFRDPRDLGSVVSGGHR